MADDWAREASNYKGGSSASSTSGGAKSSDDTVNRTQMVQTRLKQIYKKAVLPVEKRFRYDYFYESPFLSDVEFDCEYFVIVFVFALINLHDNMHE